MITKIFYYVGFASIILMALGILLILYWSFFPYKVIEFRNSEFPVKNKIVAQGEIVRYEVSYCKYMDVGASVTRSFTNGIIYNTPTVEGKKGVGCQSNIIFVPVPRELPKGTYTISVIYRYQVNPIRAVDYVVHTENFEVVEVVD